MKKRSACKYIDIPPDKTGRVVQRNNSVYTCLAPNPELPKLPACITKHYGFISEFPRSYVTREDCSTCPAWEPR